MTPKLSYLLSSARRCFDNSRLTCPSCGSAESEITDRKWAFTSLRECKKCALLFRAPTTSPEENQAFYQRAYSQGFTTDTPESDVLQTLRKTRFRGSEKDYSQIIGMLRAMGASEGSRIFDFGCSWGYGSWQMSQEGFDVTSYEISEPRARFAKEHMDVRLQDLSSIPSGTYDFFFSSHVIEHVPDPKQVLTDGLRILRSGGVFVALTPNGTTRQRRSAPRRWSQMWGLVHPQLITEKWVSHAAGTHPWFVSATPVNLHALEKWYATQEECGDLVGPELFFAVRQQ